MKSLTPIALGFTVIGLAMLVYGLTQPTEAPSDVKNEPQASVEAQIAQVPAEPMDLFQAVEIASEKYGVPSGLLLGIANAESSMGHSFVGCESSYNAWGVKPKRGEPAEPCNRYLKAYGSWLEAAEDVAQLLADHYLAENRTTPETIVRKWVGHYSSGWITNVSIYY